MTANKFFMSTLLVLLAFFWVLGSVTLFSWLINTGGTLGFILAYVSAYMSGYLAYRVFGVICKIAFKH